MNIDLLAIDLAKNTFQLHGVSSQGKPLLRKSVSRAKLPLFLQNLPPCRIVIEACGSAHYWARRAQNMGHQVQLIPAQFVKPFLKTDKSDALDAEAIAEAASRPTMRYVPIKSIEQQDVQSLHRIRSLLMKERIALSNQIRGLLAEYGVALPKGARQLIAAVPEAIADDENELTLISRQFTTELWHRYLHTKERIDQYEQQIRSLHRQSEVGQRLEDIRGIGVLTASALVAAVGNANVFKNGRQFSAWLGLVPRQHSTGGKPRTLGITKRGDRYLRMLLIHGARTVMAQAHRHDDRFSKWIIALRERRGSNIAAVAIANRMARIAWVVMARGEQYSKPV